MRSRFDAAYYRRFYTNPATRAADAAAAKRQAAFIASFLRYYDLPPRRILDLGCGLGRVLRALGKEFPKAECIGVEFSEYLCKRYGFVQDSAATYRDDPFDLVICNDVLSYLDDAACSKALANIARLTAQVAFLGILTTEDKPMADPKRTDQRQLLRPAAWYRRRLARHFLTIGAGLHLKKPVEVAVWTLDGGPSWPA